jgi:hypothetical protein
MRRYPRYKSFNIDLDLIWRRVAVEKARITAEQDASEQARRSLGVEDDQACKACPDPAGGCEECIERGY